jgi:xanthine dehydrogenase small subunit
VQFLLNGKPHELGSGAPTQTVLQYLREQMHLTGTKEGCAEGDCGACTVTEASIDAKDALRYRAVNACIRFTPTLDGKAIWTTEGVAGKDGQLHPVQQALVDHHGSQCGFCTPGFVMSLYTMYQNGLTQPAREQVLESLSGNLCRCTGYRPIIDAALNMGTYPAVEPEHAQTREQLLALRKRCATSLALETADQQYFAPCTLDELAALYAIHPDAVLLAGGTDVGLWVTKEKKNLRKVIYLGNIPELDDIREDSSYLRIAAGVDLNKGYQAVAAHYPEALEIWKRFASMPIRNSGTLVGNLANGSPIGDTAPLFIALGAKVILRKGERRRTLELEDLYLDYRKQDRVAGEFLEAVLLPLRPPGLQLASYKLSKRFDQDISAVCTAYAIALDDGKVSMVRIAHGGMAATSRRAPRAEKALLGQAWNAANVRRAMDALSGDYQPLTDMRASGTYRLKAAQNLLYRFYLESIGMTDTRV